MLFASLAAQAQSANLCHDASVFEDRNGNGLRERGERGIPGVTVSDGVRIATTDRVGRYSLPPVSGRTLFVVKPAGYRPHRREDGLPDTWINWQDTPGPALRYGGVPAAPMQCKSFALQREPRRAKPLDVLVFGDPQPKSLTDVGYYQRDIVQPLVAQGGGRAQADLGISLGDIVNDDLSLFTAIKKVDAALGVSWLHAPGNHDIDFDAPRDEESLASFRHAFGAETYAWEEPEANFIVFDDVIYMPGKKPSYVGGLRESQFAFLEAYLPTVPKGRLLVLSAHIHFYDAEPGIETFRRADRERLFRMLSAFPNVLLLTAHSHAQRHAYYGKADGWLGEGLLHEFNMGAACGGYWSGIADASGIPSATMSDGTPNGYSRLSVDRGGKYSLRWFPARESPNRQIGLHAPKVLRQGSWPGYAVYANVYMGDERSVVEYRIGDGEWKPMRRVEQADPAVLVQNLADDAAMRLRGYDRAPEASPSPHLWRGALPTDLPLGTHRIEVRTQIEGYGLATAATEYRLDPAP
ncbi:calcineurin-like phosphoesterase C-terminal domain-containing protein [Arenimonas sp.]|uniref:calcineurin-like phosphoesterase C-terminal domain-containing protein n=1 Tax=Arenimonas sp. TaxID=1872635 RepID=UPI0039E23F4C